MENIVLIIIGIAIIYQSYKLIKQQKELRKKMDRMKEDFNIEYGAIEGTGIHVVKKQYPDLELKDDFREKVSEQAPHSIAEGMNDPSEMQKKAFEEEK